MTKRTSIILVATILLAVGLLVIPVAADVYLVTSTSNAPVAGTSVTISAICDRGGISCSSPAGKTVTWSKTGTDGSFSSATSTTNGAGLATVTFTTGTVAGTAYTFTARTDSEFINGTSGTITTTAGPATQMAVNAGNAQTALTSTAVATAPSVILKDANNNPVSGASVTFAVATGGGNVTAATATTGTNGIATVGSWILGPNVGTNTLTASSAGLTSVTFTALATDASSNPTITGISPSGAVNSGSQTIEITGTGFSGSAVTLTKTGQSTITGAVVGTDTTTAISRIFNLNGVAPGTWNLVILNSGGGTVSGTFTVSNASAATVTGISPTSGTVNTTVSTTITGTNFVPASAKIRLYRNSNYIGGIVNSGGSTTSLTGSFNLNLATPGTYSVCVLTDGTESSKVCNPSFTIISTATAANGTIYFTSSPSNAAIWVDSVHKGTTPFTLSVPPGSYVVKIQKTSYLDYAQRVTVTSGNQTTVSAVLNAADTSTTVATTAPIVITTATLPPTTVKSTKTVPTPWKDTATPASPVEITVIIGALAAGALVLHRK